MGTQSLNTRRLGSCPTCLRRLKRQRGRQAPGVPPGTQHPALGERRTRARSGTAPRGASPQARGRPWRLLAWRDPPGTPPGPACGRADPCTLRSLHWPSRQSPWAPGSPARAPPTAVLNDPGIKTLGFSKKTKRTVLLRYGVGGCQACTGHGAGETVASGGNPGYRTALAAFARLGAAGIWLRQQAAPGRLLRHRPSVPPVSPASARGRSAFPPREAAAHPAGPAAPRRRRGLGWD